MAGPYQRLSNGQSADSGAQAITTVVNAVEAGLEDAEATITSHTATLATKSDTSHTHTGTYDPAGSAATAQAAAVQRANHTGTQLASTISDFNTAVRTNRLDQLTAPTTAVGMGSQRITSLGTPSASTDAVTKAYADSLAGARYGWYDVRAYGAVGDGSTNDTSAINSAIAALNSAGRGVLYFPPGDYSTTGGLTTITAAARIVGEGCGDALGANVVSKVSSSSATANLFTSTCRGTRYEGLGLFCTASTPTAGAAIYVTNVSSGVGGGDANRYYDVSSHGFYDGIHVDDGAEWYMEHCFIYNPVRYGLFIKHTDLVDGGDQSISSCQFITNSRSADAAIRQESGGGLKLTNSKINYRSGSNKFAYGVDIAIGSGVSTGVLVVTGNSIENYSAGAIRVVQSGTGTFSSGVICGNQMAPYTGSTTFVTLTGTSTSLMYGYSITGNVFTGNVSSNNSVVATNVGYLALAGNMYGVNVGALSQSGCSNVNNKDV